MSFADAAEAPSLEAAATEKNGQLIGTKLLLLKDEHKRVKS